MNTRPTSFDQAAPVGFVHDDEHPLIAVPFVLRVDGQPFRGRRASLTRLICEPGGMVVGHGPQMARLEFEFADFALAVTTQVVAGGAAEGGMVFHFAEPTGAHLPQLRYVLNAVVAGEVANLDGLLSYTGPVEPEAPKPRSERSFRERARSLATIAISSLTMLLAGSTVYERATTGHELHPVFIEPEGRQMRATAPGQLTLVDGEAAEGEVAFAITSNAGDVLAFAMPCDCRAEVAATAFEGATLLPSDLVMTVYDAAPTLRARTLMSIEGLARAMTGDHVTIELRGGRSLPVNVVATDNTHDATLRGDLYVPVELRAPGGAFDPALAGRTGRLRLSTPVVRRTLDRIGLGDPS